MNATPHATQTPGKILEAPAIDAEARPAHPLVPASARALADPRPASYPNLAKALAAAQRACKAAPLDGHNDFHKYAYSTAESIIETARAALAGSGLAVLWYRTSIDGHDRQGPDRFEFHRWGILMHESGESIPLEMVWPIVPDKGRPLDKAAASADTTSLAYFLRNLLNMPRADRQDDLAGRQDQPPKEAPARPDQPPKLLGSLLWQYDRAAVEISIARSGELVACVRKGAPPNAPEDFDQWPTDWRPNVLDTARLFVANRKHALLDGLRAILDIQWASVWHQLGLPAGSKAGELKRAEFVRVRDWLKAALAAEEQRRTAALPRP